MVYTVEVVKQFLRTGFRGVGFAINPVVASC